MNILILSYAAEPAAGSEYGVGWMVPLTMAMQYPKHEVYVVTRSRCKQKIVETLQRLRLENLHYLFYDIPAWLFYKNEMKSAWGEQLNYLLWQLLVRRHVKRWCSELHIDIVHHLTFNQYRTPSPGFWCNTPFVMGPIGGAETIAEAFYQDLQPHTIKKERIRQRGRDRSIFRWYNTRSKNKKIILCSSAENMERLQPYAADSEMRCMPAIGFAKEDFEGLNVQRDADAPFTMIYAGKALDWKGLHFFLRALAMALSDSDYRVKLIGIRFEEEQQRVNNWLQEMHLIDRVELIPFMQRDDLLKELARCDLSVYPAFRDSGSMSVLEACAVGCPTICLAVGGQDAFPEEILLKVKVGATYAESLLSFSQQLRWAYHHRSDLSTLGKRAQQWVINNMTWQQKVAQFLKIYKEFCLQPSRDVP